ncbi:MAG TPA: M10 family metallopeptidase C-terminal domain-containing protein [Aestuariivirgaceae bacterium]|jgi:serralysin
MPATSSVAPTSSAYVNAVLSGIKWAVTSFTYSFPTSSSFYGSSYGNGEPSTGFEALNSTQQTAARAALANVAAVANVTFQEITESSSQHADLRFAESDRPSTAWAYYPSAAAEGGDSWFNNSQGYYDSPTRGNYAFTAFLHELGHAMGLKHPHENSGSFNAMPLDRDSMEYSVMSYRSYIGQSTSGGYTNSSWSYAQTLMMYDIAALQTMYGANYNTNSGDSTYSWSASTGEMFINGVGQGAAGGNKIFLTVWDGGGIDTYDFSNYGSNLSIDLRPGQWSKTSSTQLAVLHYSGSQVATGNIANALLYNNDLRSLIENAIGGSADDLLTGNAGNNTLDGGAGNDTVVFSGTRSQYSVTQLSDGSIMSVDLRSGSPDGTDIVWNIEQFRFSNDTYTVAEVLVDSDEPEEPASSGLTLTGTSGNDTLTGDTLQDMLYGLAGSDLLSGNGSTDLIDGGSGNDQLYGGEGDDLLIGGVGQDRLDGGAGIDTASYQTATAGVIANLSASTKNKGEASRDIYVDIENLTGGAFADSLTGNAADNTLTGGAGKDKLYGMAGNDTLWGGSGADTINGGIGSDILVLSGASSDYTYTRNRKGVWTVTDWRSGSPDGRDTLTDVETLQFSDVSISLSSTASVSRFKHKQGWTQATDLDSLPLPTDPEDSLSLLPQNPDSDFLFS